MINDKTGHKTSWVIRKYRDYSDYLCGNRPYEVARFDDNLLLNEGITRLQNLLIGGGGTAFGNADAWLGVGNSSGSAGATQIGLSGSAVAYRPMEAT